MGVVSLTMGNSVRPVERAQQLVVGKSQAFDLPKIQQPHDFMLGIDALAAPLIPGHVEQADAFIIAQRVHADADILFLSFSAFILQRL